MNEPWIRYSAATALALMLLAGSAAAREFEQRVPAEPRNRCTKRFHPLGA